MTLQLLLAPLTPPPGLGVRASLLPVKSAIDAEPNGRRPTTKPVRAAPAGVWRATAELAADQARQAWQRRRCTRGAQRRRLVVVNQSTADADSCVAMTALKASGGGGVHLASHGVGATLGRAARPLRQAHVGARQSRSPQATRRLRSLVDNCWASGQNLSWQHRQVLEPMRRLLWRAPYRELRAAAEMCCLCRPSARKPWIGNC